MKNRGYGPRGGQAVRKELEYHGLDGVPYLDKVTGERELQDGAVRFDGETDNVYDGTGEDLIGYLRDMTLARRFDVEATALQRKGELGMWPPSLGQEAAQVGSARALGAKDVVFPSYREHAVAHCLGVPLKQILALFRGCDAGDWEMLDRFRNYQIVIGAQTLHATGYAMGLQFDGLVGNG